MNLKIGLNEDNRKKIAHNLNYLLANTFVLYAETLNFHWNTVGDKFQPMHNVYEEQYQELISAIDVIAERIRALGYKSPGRLSDFLKLATINEPDEINVEENEMIRKLTQDNECISEHIRRIMPEISELGDEATVDMLNKRLAVHDKVSWMLRSFLKEGSKDLA